MNKYEYEIKRDQIKKLADEREYKKALKIVDSIDWNLVRSVKMLNLVSRIYKYNRCYTECLGILKILEMKNPESRFTIYSLSEVYIKLGRILEALQYYNKFLAVAPNDSNACILLYNIYILQDVSIEERITLLEGYLQKEQNADEKWYYELAYLYYKIGMATQCVEVCDSLIVLFGTGKYVMKAMELKMMYVTLTPSQQAKYDLSRRKAKKKRNQKESMDIQVKQVDVGEYNTSNLQQEIAASLQELFHTEEVGVEGDQLQGESSNQVEQEVFIETGSMPDGLVEYEEINAMGREREEIPLERNVREMVIPILQDTVEIRKDDRLAIHEEEIYFQVKHQVVEEVEEELEEEVDNQLEDDQILEYAPKGLYPIEIKSEGKEEYIFTKEEVGIDVSEESLLEEVVEVAEEYQQQVDVNTQGQFLVKMETSEPYSQILSQELDGQIGLMLPNSEEIERQITGQLNLEEILMEWERIKEENAQKRKEEIDQHVIDCTSDMFSEFDAATKQEILMELNELTYEDDESNLAMTEEEENEITLDEVIDLGEEELQEFIEDKLELVDAIEDDFEEEEGYEEAEEIGYEEAEEIGYEEAEEIGYEEAEEIGYEEAEEIGYEEVEEEGNKEPEDLEQEVAEGNKELEDLEQEVEEDNKESEHLEEEVEENESTKQEEPDWSLESIEQMQGGRTFNRVQKVLFESFVKLPKCREQILDAIEGISPAANIGNVIITGDSQEKNAKLATRLVRELKEKNPNFSGKIGQVTAQQLNRRDVSDVLGKLQNGALIIANGEHLNNQSINTMIKYIDQCDHGIVIFLQGVKHDLEKLLKRRKDLQEVFQLRVDVEEVNNDSLAKYGVQYAYNLEYGIDELGLLALHTRISLIQTNAHQATMKDVENIIKEAIQHAEQNNFTHFMDVLLGKRFNKEDMILLKEHDFIRK
ncbi:MAG: hypothetical protein R3Y54_04040 [Eubacteriales bacterium]